MSARSPAGTPLLVALLLGIFVLSGCASLTNKAADSHSFAPLIAQDLVGVLVQLEPLPVETTVLKLSPEAFADDDFALALRRSLEEAGYAIRVSGSESGSQMVSFSVTQKTQPVAGIVSTYTVNAGDVSVRRSYATSTEGLAEPIGTMQVRGADAATVQLDNQLFEPKEQVIVGEVAVKGDSPEPLVLSASPAALPETASVVSVQPEPSVFTNAEQEQPLALLQPEVQSSQPLLDIAAPSVAGSAAPIQEFGSVARLADLPTQNIRDLGESNFAGVFDEFGIVDEAILRFGNDSIRLGQDNKARMERFIEQFDADSDVLSVIGCSNGPTSLSIGQEGLALGRARRVKEELLYAGVPEANILDEGCWADEYFDSRMPRRGVVLTLKRRAS